MISNVLFENSINGSVIIKPASPDTRMLLEDCMFDNITNLDESDGGAVVFTDPGGEAIQVKLCTKNCYGTGWAHFSYVWAESGSSKRDYFNHSSLNLCGRDLETGIAPYELAFGKVRDTHMNVSNTITHERAMYSMYRHDEDSLCSYSIFINNSCKIFGLYHESENWGIEYCIITKNKIESSLISCPGNFNITKCIFSYNKGENMYSSDTFTIFDAYFFGNDENYNCSSPNYFKLIFDISNKCPNTIQYFKGYLAPETIDENYGNNLFKVIELPALYIVSTLE